MSLYPRLTACGVAAATTVLFGDAGAFAQEIAIADAPAALRAVADGVAPGVEFTTVEVEIEDGARIFEFSGIGFDGRRVEVDVTEAGALDEIEMEQSAEDLPAAVRAAVAKVAPDSDIVAVETSVHGDGVFLYEVETRTGAGDLVAYELTEEGRIVRREDAAVS